jgi:exodeoxyribonuclease-5
MNDLLDLTEGQQKGLEMVSRLMKYPGAAVGVLAGYAGTGKTTLLREVASAVGGLPMILSPTGRAAARIKEATGLPAMTAHRWQYMPVTDPKTGLTKWDKLPLEKLATGSAGLLVVEESSMVSRSLWDDIWENATALCLKVLAIGDPFQLPPVDPEDGGSGFSLLDPNNGYTNEYVLMKQIVRQALESPIIRASMAIRAGDALKGIGELPKVTPVNFLDRADTVQSRGGMVIVHRNKTRNHLNRQIRAARNLPGEALQEGESLLVIRNNYLTSSFNGELYTFADWIEPPAGKHVVYDFVNKRNEESRFGVARITDPENKRSFAATLSEAEVFGQLQAPPSAIKKTADIVHPERPFINANFGYAMTCHKAQGSEADEVLVGIEPSIPFWKEEGLRFLYTAVTRAIRRCSVCIGYSP